MLRSHFCFCILCSLLGLTLVLLLMWGAVPTVQAQDKKPVSFINEVAPILRENCFACHDAKMKKGKFHLTTFADFQRGGTKGEVLVPGKAKESLLINYLTRRDKRRMPPPNSGEALPKEKVALIARWINEGAKVDISPKADLYKELLARWQPPQPPASYKFPVVIDSVAITPDGKNLVVSGFHELTIWNIDQGRLVRRLYTRTERARGMVFLPDGRLAVAGDRPGQEGDVCIFDLHAGTPKMVNGIPAVDGVNDQAVQLAMLLRADDSILGLALSADGKKLAAGGCDRRVRVWDLRAGYAKAKLEHTYTNHSDWVFALAFSPDGKQLATGSRDKSAKVYDLASKETLLTFADHQATVYGVALTAEGKSGVSVGEDGSVRSWAANGSSKQNKLLGSHAKKVFRIVHHADAKKPLLASGSADNTVRLWNATTGAPLKTLTGHTDWVSALAFSADGSLIASGSWNGEVRIWKTADGSLVKAFNATPGFPAPTAQVNKKEDK